jgi:hypothetical protein
VRLQNLVLMPVLVNTPLSILYNIRSIFFISKYWLSPRDISLYSQPRYRFSELPGSLVFSIACVVPIG